MPRTPFTPPLGCPPITVDLDILGDLPFCSIPELTEPSFVPRIVVVDPPDIAVPEPCVCVSVNVNTSIRVDDVSARISANWSQATNDCCDAGYKLDLAVDVPCMPFGIDSTLKVSVADVADVSGNLLVTNDDCALGLNLDLVIPCVPFTIDDDPSAVQVLITDVSAPLLSIGLQQNGCELRLGMDLELPCMPFAIDDDQTSVKVSVKDVSTPFLSVGLRHEDCVLHWNMDLDLPCVPFALDDDQTDVQVTVTDVAAPALSIGLWQVGCELHWGVDLDLPCMPFATDAKAVPVAGTVSGPGEFSLNLGLVQHSCTLSIVGDYKVTFPTVEIPCFTFSVDPLQLSTVRLSIKPVSFGAVDFGERPNFSLGLSQDDCVLRMGAHLVLPCIPFSLYESQDKVKVSVKNVTEPALSIGLIQEDCRLQWGVDLDLPCMPFTVAATAVAIPIEVDTPVATGGQTPSATLSLNLQLVQNGCKLVIDGDGALTLPQLPYITVLLTS